MALVQTLAGRWRQIDDGERDPLTINEFGQRGFIGKHHEHLERNFEQAANALHHMVMTIR